MMKAIVDQLFLDQKKLALAAIIAAAVVYCDAAYLIGGQAKAVGAQKKSIAGKTAEIDGIRRDLALMGRQSQNNAAVRMFAENAIPQLLQYISATAAGRNIKLLQITPLKSKEAKKTQTQSYLSVVIKLDLVGGYHDVGGFINDLERGEHPLFAEDFKIIQGDDFLKQRVSLNLRTYVKK